MEFAAFITGQGESWTYQGLRDAFVAAEEAGFEVAWTMDNSVGSMKTGRDQPVPEAWTVLPGIAEATSRIRLGPLVTPAGRRPLALLAKMTSVFDQMSGGRLELGLGAGDDADYFEPFGIRYPPAKVRVARLAEQIEVLKLMWTEDRVNYRGEHVILTDAVNRPKPLQEPHPPIWIGLTRSKRLMPQLAARHADAINIHIPEAQAREMLEIFKRYCGEIGRDPDPVRKSRNALVAVTDSEPDLRPVIRREADEGIGEFNALVANITDYENLVVGPAQQCVEKLRELARGFDQLIIKFPGIDAENRLYTTTPEGSIQGIRRFAAEVMPHLRG